MHTPNYLLALVTALVVNILTISAVHAKICIGCLKLEPYVGVEYQYQHIKANSTWHDAAILPANFNNYSVFIGTKYHPNFGIEFGYYHYFKYSQAQANVANFNGQAVPTNPLVIGQMRMRGFSADWNAHYFLDPKFNVFALIGAATYDPLLNFVTNDNSNFGQAISTVHAKNKTVLRLGVGAEYLEKWWGVRTRILWDRTQSLELDVSQAQPLFGAIPPQAFDQSFVVTLGVFFRF